MKPCRYKDHFMKEHNHYSPHAMLATIPLFALLTLLTYSVHVRWTSRSCRQRVCLTRAPPSARAAGRALRAVRRQPRHRLARIGGVPEDVRVAAATGLCSWQRVTARAHTRRRYTHWMIATLIVLLVTVDQVRMLVGQTLEQQQGLPGLYRSLSTGACPPPPRIATDLSSGPTDACGRSDVRLLAGSRLASTTAPHQILCFHLLWQPSIVRAGARVPT